MKHFVQYHNTEKMGHRCDTGTDTLHVLTNKVVGDVRGDTVWLIAGDGKPRRYCLCEVFTVAEVGPSEDRRFTSEVTGTKGQQFRPPVPIGEEAWFSDFRISQQNFRLGFNEIASRFVPEFERLARRRR